MIHFAYPNADISKKKILGLGSYVSLSEKEPPDGYVIANLASVNISKIHQILEKLVPESSGKPEKYIYQKKTDNPVIYIGDSQDLAYLLALINRFREIGLQTEGDIWCTGTIDITGDKSPLLDTVKTAGFDIKLNAFLNEKENIKDKIFIVPAANIHPNHESLCEQENIEILSLKDFQPCIQKKTILTVQGSELDLLVKKIFRRSAFPFSDLKVFFLATLSVTYLMFFLLWLHAFNFIYIDAIIERYTIAFGDFLITQEKEKNFSDKIALVAIEDKSFDISWREKHALLIDKLSEAGAEVIVFDMYFEEQSEFDTKFIEAIERVRNKGTDVIVGVSELQKNEPKIFKELKEAVSGYGILGINETLLYSTKAPLLVIKADGARFDSLSLAVANAFYRKDFIGRIEEQAVFFKHPDENISSEEIKINLSDVEYSRDSCPAIHEGDQVADMFIDLSPPDFLKSPKRRFLYDEIISSDSDMRQQFEGKIVLVGVQIRNKDCLSVHRGLKNEKCCFGMEIHADVLNTILSGVHIQEYSPKQQLVFIILSAILGAVLVYAYQNLNSPYLEISLLLFSLIFIFSLTSLYFYTQYRILLNTAYYAAASLLTYGAVRLSNDRKA